MTCPQCQQAPLRRTQRTLGEKIAQRVVAAYECEQCGVRHTVRAVKHCWRCGTDLDRRRRQTVADWIASALLLWPYSCRRCGKRRYRWGKRSG